MKRIILGLGLAALTIATSQKALAGAGGGNGGDAVVCPQGIYMLDSVESERRGNPLTIKTEEETLSSKLDLLLKRLEKKDKSLAQELRLRAEVLVEGINDFERTGQVEQENISFTDGELVNVADEGATYIPSGCKIEQLIIQNKSPLPGDKKFLIQKNLWKKMELNEKAAGVLHESIYGYLIDHNINSSPSSRYLNGLVISNKVDSLKSTDYQALLAKLGFPHKGIANFDLRFDQVDLSMGCQVNGGELQQVEVSLNKDQQRGQTSTIRSARRKPISIQLVRVGNRVVVGMGIKNVYYGEQDLSRAEINKELSYNFASSGYGASEIVKCTIQKVSRFPDIQFARALSCKDGMYVTSPVTKYTEVSTGATSFSLSYFVDEELATFTRTEESLVFRSNTMSLIMNLQSGQAVLNSSDYSDASKVVQCKLITNI